MYFDTHVHLNSHRYENIEEIINNAIENKVTKMVVIGYDLKSSIKANELSKSYNDFKQIIG